MSGRDSLAKRTLCSRVMYVREPLDPQHSRSLHCHSTSYLQYDLYGNVCATFAICSSAAMLFVDMQRRLSCTQSHPYSITQRIHAV